jgi:hypothetical protein
VHEVTNWPAEYVPAAHEAHKPVLTGLISPALQSKFEHVLAPMTVENQPVAHLVHKPALPAEYVPEPHLVQTDEPTPEN